MSSFELATLSFFNALNYLTRYLLAAVKPALSADLGFSHEQMGWLLAAWAFGYVVATPFFGLLGYRLSRPRLLASMVLGWSVSLLLFGFVRTFLLMALLRVALGITQAGFSTLVPGYLADRIKDDSRVTGALSILVCAIPVGTAMAYGLGAMFANWAGWATTFIVFALPGLLLGWLLFRWPEATPEAVPRHVPIGDGLRQVLASPALRYGIGGYILNSFGMNGIAGFIQDYGVERGFALDEIGAYFLGILLMGSAGTVLGGTLCSRWERASKRPAIQILFSFIAITGLLGVPWLLGSFLVNDRHLFITLCGIGVLFVFIGTGPLNAILVRGSPNGLVNFVQGVTIVSLNLFGSFIAPPIVGAIADNYSLRAGLLVCTGSLFLSAIVWFVGIRQGRHAL